MEASTSIESVAGKNPGPPPARPAENRPVVNLFAGFKSQGKLAPDMIEKTISEIEAKISGADSVSAERKQELLKLLGTLKTEVPVGGHKSATASHQLAHWRFLYPEMGIINLRGSLTGNNVPSPYRSPLEKICLYR